jgi:hypothetical protein
MKSFPISFNEIAFSSITTSIFYESYQIDFSAQRFALTGAGAGVDGALVPQKKLEARKNLKL